MRWIQKPPVKIEPGTTRTVTKFLFWPRCYDNHDVRWLEFARIEEEYNHYWSTFYEIYYYGWKAQKFID